MPTENDKIAKKIEKLEQELAALTKKEAATRASLPAKRAAVQQAYQTCQGKAGAGVGLAHGAKEHQRLVEVDPVELSGFPLCKEPRWAKAVAALCAAHAAGKKQLRLAFAELPARALVLLDPDWEKAADGFPDLGEGLEHAIDYYSLVGDPEELDKLSVDASPFDKLWSETRKQLLKHWRAWAKARGKRPGALTKELEAKSPRSADEDDWVRLVPVMRWAKKGRTYPQRMGNAMFAVFTEIYARTGLAGALRAYDDARDALLFARSEVESLAWSVKNAQRMIGLYKTEQTRLEQSGEVLRFLERQKQELGGKLPREKPWFRTEEDPDFPGLARKKKAVFDAVADVAAGILSPDKKHERCAFLSYVSFDVRHRLRYAYAMENRYRKKGTWNAKLAKTYQKWLVEEQQFQAQRLGAEVAKAASADTRCSCSAGRAMRDLQKKVDALASYLQSPECLTHIERVDGSAADYLREQINFIKGFRPYYYGDHLYQELLAVRFHRLYLEYVEDLVEILRDKKTKILKWEDGKLEFRSGQTEEVTLLKTPPLPPSPRTPWFKPDFMATLEDPVRRVEAMLAVVEVQQVLRTPRPQIRASEKELTALFDNLMDENAIQRWDKDRQWLEFCDRFVLLINQLLIMTMPADELGRARILARLTVHMGLISGTDDPEAKIRRARAPFEALAKALRERKAGEECVPADSSDSLLMRGFNTVVKAGKLPKRVWNAWRAAFDAEPNISSPGEAILGGAVALGAAISLVYAFKTNEEWSTRDKLSAASDFLTIIAAAEDGIFAWRQASLAKRIAKLPKVEGWRARRFVNRALNQRWMLRAGLQCLGVLADGFVFYIDFKNFCDSYGAGHYKQAIGDGTALVGSGLVLAGTSLGTFATIAKGAGWLVAGGKALAVIGTVGAWCLGIGVAVVIIGLVVAWALSEGSEEEKYRKAWLRGMGRFYVLDPQYSIINFHQGVRSKKFDQLAEKTGSVRIMLAWPGKKKKLYARFMDSDGEGTDDVIPYDGKKSVEITTDEHGHVYFAPDKLKAGLYQQSEGLIGSYADLYLELSEDDTFTAGETWYSKYYYCELETSGNAATIVDATEQDYGGIDAR